MRWSGVSLLTTRGIDDYARTSSSDDLGDQDNNKTTIIPPRGLSSGTAALGVVVNFSFLNPITEVGAMERRVVANDTWDQ